jgi:hypothetical protein
MADNIDLVNVVKEVRHSPRRYIMESGDALFNLHRSSAALDGFSAQKTYAMRLDDLTAPNGLIPRGLCRDDIRQMYNVMAWDRHTQAMWIVFYWSEHAEQSDSHLQPCHCQICRLNAPARVARIVADQRRFDDETAVRTAKVARLNKLNPLCSLRRFFIIAVVLFGMGGMGYAGIAILAALLIIAAAVVTIVLASPEELPMPKPVTDGRAYVVDLDDM